MEEVASLRAFKYLAAVSIAAGCGLIRPGPRLLRLPEAVVSELVEDMGESETHRGWPKSTRAGVVLLLAEDPRQAIRARVAESAPALLPEQPHEAAHVVRALARDQSAEVRSAAVRGFEALLERISPVARAQLVCEWAVSESVADRQMVARALESKSPVLFADLVIDQLSNDPEARVRRAALRAANRRFDEYPAAYTAVAARLTADADRRVRRAARRVLKRSYYLTSAAWPSESSRTMLTT